MSPRAGYAITACEEAIPDRVISISVCIATHRRPRLLAGTLEGLALQTRLPQEIIVSESSPGDGESVVRDFTARHPDLRVVYLPSSRKELPWQRGWAYQHARSDVILFLDDDVVLSPPALETLERTYADLMTEPARSVAGVGFRMVYDDGTQPTRDPRSVRERWLGVSPRKSGSLTKGGLTVTIADLKGETPVEVDVLWGGAMSFRRESLAGIPLENLVSLYAAGIGRGEDAVLSCHARKSGKLFVLTEPFAVHPSPDTDTGAETPYARDGWKMGVTHTYGRAHTMRWMAEDWTSYRRDWWRIVTLELVRNVLSVLRAPWRSEGWLQLGGACFGIGRSMLDWHRIPRTASSDGRDNGPSALMGH